MSVAFKKVLRKNPQNKEEKGKFYPQLVVVGSPATLDTIAAKMKEHSSLSKGDIHSVLINFVEVMLEELYNGHSVSIDRFGTFSLSCAAEGAETKKECTPANITLMYINFRAASAIRPVANAKKKEDQIDFVDVETIAGVTAATNGSNGSDSSGDTSGETNDGSDTGGEDNGNTDNGGGSSSGGSGTGDDEVEQL